MKRRPSLCARCVAAGLAAAPCLLAAHRVLPDCVCELHVHSELPAPSGAPLAPAVLYATTSSNATTASVTVMGNLPHLV
jgi:hypothetical protein